VDDAGSGAATEGEATSAPRVHVDDADVAAAAARALAPPTVETIAFDALVTGGEQARWRWLHALSLHGATLITGVPERVGQETSAAAGGGVNGSANGGSLDGVRYVAELIGPLQPNIYGDLFDVVTKGEAAEVCDGRSK